MARRIALSSPLLVMLGGLITAAAPARPQAPAASQAPAAPGDGVPKDEGNGTADREQGPRRRVDENVVQQATDAFGLDIGGATIGLYSEDATRGFSPALAGNIRIEGLYFDRQGLTNSRLLRSTSVRVGPTALGETLPAPSGVVRYSLRLPADAPGGSLIAGLEAYGSPIVELDATYAEPGRRWKIGFGGSVVPALRDDAGGEGFVATAAVLPSWSDGNLRLHAFASQKIYRDLYLAPRVFAGSGVLPPRVERGRMVGQRWATTSGEDSNAGVIAEIDDFKGFKLRGGLFYSLWTPDETIAQLDVGTDPAGMARRIAVQFPGQSYGSLSGELQLIRHWQAGSWRHSLTASLRGRAFRGTYGGQVVSDLGFRRIDDRVQLPRPGIRHKDQAHDRIEQRTIGLSYIGAWGRRAQFNLGIQTTEFEKLYRAPAAVPVETRANPLLGNVAAGIELAPGFVAYAGYSRGLEETGTSPASARNPNEVLSPSITEQIDGGFRWKPRSEVSLIAGAFRITRAYANVDSSNWFRFIGQLENRGVELSLSWRPRPTITIVAGGLYQDPRVRTGNARLVPVSVPRSMARVDADWTVSSGSSISLDGTILYVGSIPVLSDNSLRSPPLVTANIGFRWRFGLGQRRALLRGQLLNITNAFSWRPQPSGALLYNAPRRFRVTVTTDF
ncbi:MAG TPA: TonB-dependent receptor [Allosphingosinicella sp.]|nr:TonB-dependent receptor [Allosphingosinicella sp.]